MIEISFCRKSSCETRGEQIVPTTTTNKSEHTSWKPISFVDLCTLKFHCIQNGIITRTCSVCDGRNMSGALDGNEEMSSHQADCKCLYELKRELALGGILCMHARTHAPNTVQSFEMCDVDDFEYKFNSKPVIA